MPFWSKKTKKPISKSVADIEAAGEEEIKKIDAASKELSQYTNLKIDECNKLENKEEGIECLREVQKIDRRAFLRGGKRRRRKSRKSRRKSRKTKRKRRKSRKTKKRRKRRRRKSRKSRKSRRKSRKTKRKRRKSRKTKRKRRKSRK